MVVLGTPILKTNRFFSLLIIIIIALLVSLTSTVIVLALFLFFLDLSSVFGLPSRLLYFAVVVVSFFCHDCRVCQHYMALTLTSFHDYQASSPYRGGGC